MKKVIVKMLFIPKYLLTCEGFPNYINMCTYLQLFTDFLPQGHIDQALKKVLDIAACQKMDYNVNEIITNHQP